MKIKKVLLHPLTIFLSMAMGAYLGFCFPSLGPMAGSLGSLYLNCFQMCVLPLITAAVFNSVLSLCSNIEGMIGFLKKLISLFCFGMLGTTISGVIISVLFSSGSKIDVTSQGILGSFVNKESNISDKLVLRNGLDFLHMIIPQNPFTAFAEGSGLKVLFFSIVMGIAFSRGNKERVDLWSNIMGELFDSCIRVLNFLVLLLPFGMVFIFANQFSLITFDVINALGKFLSLSIITIFAFIFLNIFILKLSSGKKFLETIKGISGTIALAFASSSCFVTMPQMISDMEQNFKISSSRLKLIIPLGINMSPQGTCLVISMFFMFFAQMYHIAIDINVLLIIIFGTMMISMAISGLPCLVGVSLISTLLESIGVPPGVSSAILLAIFPIIDPPLTILNCLGNCTYSSILARTPAVAKIPLAHEDAQNSMA